MEKRASERITTDLWVSCSSGSATFYGVAINISKNGMYINTGMRLPSELDLEIFISLPSNDVLSVPAKFCRLIRQLVFMTVLVLSLLIRLRSIWNI